MKYEWKKADKQIYLPKEFPQVLDVPKFKYIIIDGQGDPNSEDFKKRVEVLYSLSYWIKMAPKKGIELEGYYDYTVFPLEGVWDLIKYNLTDKGIDKDNLKYSIMIRQPNFVTKDSFNFILEHVKNKTKNNLLDFGYFEEITEGRCIQILHKGSFDDEPASFEKMNLYCQKNDLERLSKAHREIYLSDFRKTKTEDLKTVLRYKIK